MSDKNRMRHDLHRIQIPIFGNFPTITWRQITNEKQHNISVKKIIRVLLIFPKNLKPVRAPWI